MLGMRDRVREGLKRGGFRVIGPSNENTFMATFIIKPDIIKIKTFFEIRGGVVSCEKERGVVGIRAN